MLLESGTLKITMNSSTRDLVRVSWKSLYVLSLETYSSHNIHISDEKLIKRTSFDVEMHVLRRIIKTKNLKYQFMLHHKKLPKINNNTN